MKEARHAAILRQLRLRGTVSTEDLARDLRVSVVSVRRDLRELEQEGRLRRVHGGAVVPKPAARDEGALDAAALGLHSASARPDGPLAVIGLVVPTSAYYFSQIIQGAGRAANAAGVRLILAVSDYGAQKEIELVRHLTAVGVDAIVFTPAYHDLSTPAVRSLLAAPPVPIVVLERVPQQGVDAPRFDGVRTDHEFGAETAVRHLYDTGRRRIALLGLPNATAPQLQRGYARAVAGLGLDPLVVDVGSGPHGFHEWAADVDVLVERYLSEADRLEVDGVVINPDMHAVAFARALVARGTRIPEDVAVVSYDDEVAHLCEIPLTAVAPPRADLGATAISLCLQRLRADAEGREPATSHTVLLPELVPRASTLGEDHPDVRMHILK